jgi:23S rRNA pseudouridine1911/1915/1917 synthase
VNDRGKGLFEVIYEDSEFLAINKQAGLVCHPTKADEYSSLISRVRLYLGPEGRPQLINRLDRETSGVTVLAKTEDAARRLRRLWEGRQVKKEYLAVVHGHVAEAHKLVAARLGKDELSVVAIKDCVRDDGAESQTEFWVEKRFEKHIPASCGATSARDQRQLLPVVGPTRSFSLLKVVPHTGRKHQIRIHLSHLGYPIVGDKLYGGEEDLYLALVENRLTEEQRSRLILPHHALHAAEVSFHWNGVHTAFRAEPEPWFKAFCSSAPIPE